MKRYNRSSIPEMVEVGKAEARRLEGDLSILLGDLAGHLQRQAEARQGDAEEIRRLRALVERLGGGFDARGLHGDPREKRVWERIHLGSVVDMESPL